MAYVLHERVADVKGVGKWDLATGRYIPVSGGSRSRLPLIDDKDYPRYAGFIGVDESASAEIFTMPALYSLIGGAASVPQGHGNVIVKLILENAIQRRKEYEAAER
jgi:hypothetical protein